MAEDEGIPPYRIFTNRSLAEMATYRPESLEELQGLHGIGVEVNEAALSKVTADHTVIE